MKRFASFAVVLALLAAGCSAEPEAAAGGAASSWHPAGPTRMLTLPGGEQIEVELRLTPEDQASGMMFRPALPPDKGMLFLFDSMEPRAFWMFQTPHPLDMIWLDDTKRIVEMHENAPPCRARDFRECPNYGGNAASLTVLELAAGSVTRRGLKVGDRLEF